MTSKHTPFHPIIYVRGYAMTSGEINETTADPFCGFNLGSTVYRAVPDKNAPPRKYVFESPVVRLASDFNYLDVYEDGYDIMDNGWETNAEGKPTENKLGSRSIIIFRYYDEASSLLGRSEEPDIKNFGSRLGDLILRIRELVCKNNKNGIAPEDFRCYLVAHSMGGLVCRAFLQNPELDPNNARQYVDKFFTYATPHNGIEMGGINVPKWLSLNHTNTFNRGLMTDYLGLAKRKIPKGGRVDWLPEERLSPEKVFCMVGTNRMDYEVAMGLSRSFAGHGSDGLVRIDNATLRGLKQNGEPGAHCAKAFTFRSHSGYFGIVNSEEAFQNLVRFLFGDVRVDLWIDLEEIRLPKTIMDMPKNKQADLNALYQIELTASPRGKPWLLTRRKSEEDSVACVTHQDWLANTGEARSVYLSTVFLANRSKVNKRGKTLSYGMNVGIRVPDYEIKNTIWPNEHYEGAYLFSDALRLDLSEPANVGEPWSVKYAWQGSGVNALPDEAPPGALVQAGKSMTLSVPFESITRNQAGTASPAFPGVKGTLRFVVTPWNPDAQMDE